MLEDMQRELEVAKEDDDAVYQKLTCWCEGGAGEKKKAITLGEASIADLKSAQGEFVAKIEELRESLASTKKKLIEDQEALETAKALRMKESKSFHGEETDMLEAIQSCKQALVVLSKHHSLAQVQQVSKQLQALAAMNLAKDNLGRDKMAVLKAFVQETEESKRIFRGPQSYEPQSGQIVGILKQMKEDFESDLSETQKDEKRAIDEFQQLREAKESELVAGKAQRDQLQQDDAEFREKNAQAYEEMNDTMEQVKTDKVFLRNLDKMCATADKDYAARTQGRLAEMEAVAETISFLNSDAAYESFDRTVNSAFFQVSSKSSNDQRSRAADVLRRSGNAALAVLAVRVQLDAFDKVKQAIDEMVVELKKQQQDEVEHRDWCIAETNTNERETEELYDKKSNLETLMADTEKSIKELARDIDQKAKEIVTMQADMKKASEVREGENADFQKQITDQVITQAILQKACDRMKQVYSEYKVSLEQEDKPGAEHTQTSGTDTDPGNGPVKFKKYDQNAAGDKIVAMIETIVKDSKGAENELRRDEADSQAGYENSMKDLNKSITDYTRAIVNNKENKAKAEQTFTAAKEDFTANMNELEGLHEVLGSLQKQCDFLVKNFDLRQQARSQEIDALNEAKAILGGMQ